MAVRKKYLSALSAATDVTFTGAGDGVEVVNLDGVGVIFVTTSGTASAADEMYMIPAAAGAHLVIRGNPAGKTYSCFATAATKVGLQVVDGV